MNNNTINIGNIFVYISKKLKTKFSETNIDNVIADGPTINGIEIGNIENESKYSSLKSLSINFSFLCDLFSNNISNAMTKTSDSSQTNVDRAVDTDTGVSIMKYTGNGAISTILHGLGKAPGMVWIKATGKSSVCKAWHTGLSNATRSYIVFAANQAETNFSDDRVWGAGHTSTAIGVGTHTYTNNNTDAYIAYAFSEVEGFSKFGTYKGNNNVDGAFVYLGFKPALLILKKTASGSWYVWDNGRMVTNPAGGAVYPLRPDDTATESSIGSGGLIDFLGNGFKIRSTWGDINGSGVTVTYSAWAESPFSGNNRGK